MANETVALVRWIVPNYAVVDEPPRPRQDGLRPSKTIPIHDLSQSALDSLANDWLDDLYAKAGKPHPPYGKEVKMGERLTDRTAVYLALCIAIEYEKSVVDAYRPDFGDLDETEQAVKTARRRIAAYERVLNRHLGGRKKTPLEKILEEGTLVDAQTLQPIATPPLDRSM